jgi:AraC family transcriptional regulator
MQVEITSRPELRVAALRHDGPYERIPEAFARLGPIAGKAGLIGGAASMIAIYHDDPEVTPAEKLRSDAGVTIPPTAKLPAGLTEVKVPAGSYAHATHKGPYERLGDTWARLKEWLATNGKLAGDGPGFELYRNTPMTAAPNELVTELYMPIR